MTIVAPTGRFARGPVGSAGDTGAIGDTGPTGNSGVSAWTYTTAPFTLPASDGTVVVEVADPQWIEIGQSLIIDGIVYQVEQVDQSEITLRRRADPPSISVPGVTDGSVAATGEIGEILTATYTQTQGVMHITTIVVAWLSVPPGDWDCWAHMSYVDLADGPGMWLQGSLRIGNWGQPAYANFPFSSPAFGNTWWHRAIELGPFRVVTEQPQTVIFTVDYTQWQATIRYTGTITARRGSLYGVV